ncbi:MAG: trigger factor [Patescibacteria group bacterium]|nr:trigger factor [Patescibacteria group bacterium]
MITHAIHKKEDGTIELTVTIPWEEVSNVYNQVVDDIVKNTEIPGFRKGKAPRSMVEEKIDRSKAYEDVIRKLLPDVYNTVITKENIKPIISPKIELKQAKEHEDWILVIYTCERPSVTLGDYRKVISDKKADKYKKIWLPGQDKKEEEQTKKPTIDEILQWTSEAIIITIPRLLLEQEVNRLLSELIDQTKTLGLTVEQYLSATGKTSESIRKEYESQAEQTIKLEFGLEAIADKEGIIVSDDDIDAVIKKAKTDEEKKSLEGQRYYLASILRRQKTIDFLANIA